METKDNSPAVSAEAYLKEMFQTQFTKDLPAIGSYNLPKLLEGYAAITLKDRDRELKDALARNEKLVEALKNIMNHCNSTATGTTIYNTARKALAAHEKEQEGKG